MLKIEYYYNPSTLGFYQSDINTVIPENSIAISKEEKDRLLNSLSKGDEILLVNGTLVVKPRVLDIIDMSEEERSWRNLELKRADIELNKVQDSDSKASGTVSQWREYRKALRSLPEHADFPNVSARPIAPDA